MALFARRLNRGGPERSDIKVKLGDFVLLFISVLLPGAF